MQLYIYSFYSNFAQVTECQIVTVCFTAHYRYSYLLTYLLTYLYCPNFRSHLSSLLSRTVT